MTINAHGVLYLPSGGTIAWNLAPCLLMLGTQVQNAHPGAVVGTIGDAAHLAQGRPAFDPSTGRPYGGTDHEPDIPNDEVCAADFMHGTGGLDARALFETLRTHPHPSLNYLEAENLPFPGFGGRKIEAARDHGFTANDVGPSSAGPHCHASVLHLPSQTHNMLPWTLDPSQPSPTHGGTVPTSKAPIVASARTPSGRGYWFLARDGGVFTDGDASFHGSAAGHTSDAVDLCPHPSGTGYWILGADGGVFTCNVPFFGSASGHVTGRAVRIVATASGQGYWIFAADGGVFSYGDARFYGSITVAP